MKRPAIAMIELIFAIVIIAISVLSIPSILAVANNASKGILIDEDILIRLSGEIIRVSQARWDQNSTAPEFRPLLITGTVPEDMVCDRNVSGILYRRNPDSTLPCSSASPSMPTTPTDGDFLNLTKGIEQLHNQSYDLEINATNSYIIPITYRVSYVQATTSAINADGVATATWTLGSSADMNPDPSSTQTHLKRIVVNAGSTNTDTNMTLTFFKSNVGKFAE